jgi:tetratricopeptide (TPR) repeat protein
MAKKRKRKFTEDFIEKWKETATEDERSKTRRILKKQERQLKKDPKNVNLWFARGELLKSIDEYEKALICYEAVIRLEPDHKVVYNARGRVLEALGRKDEAVESYQKALKLTEEAEQEIEPEEEVEEVEEILAEDLRQLIGDVTSPERIEKIAEGIRLPKEKVEEPEEEAEDVEEYFECPMCGELLDPEETGCPMCGAEFVEEVDKEKILERLESLESEILEEEEEFSPLEDSLRRKLEKWRRDGYNVLPLENIMRREPDRARSAAFRFEENLKKVEILRESLESLPESGYEEEIEKIELMLRSP